MVSNDWKNILPFLTFPADSKTKFSTSINTRTPGDSKLAAEISLKNIKCWNLFLENFNSTLYVRDKHLVFEVKDTDFYGGKADVLYSHDFEENVRSLGINTEKVSLPGILTRLSQKSLDKIAGAITTELNLKLVDPGKDSKVDFELSGKGKLQISDGNFWKVPLLSEFMGNIDAMLPVKASGRIQEIHGDLIFKNHKILVPKFISDGSILALSGNGEYDWQDNSFNFLFNTHYLKSILTLPKPLNFDLLSPIFSPVSTVMKGRLTGDLDEYKWQLESFRKIKDFIS